MTPLRVGLLGARRARNGLGPFVARDLVAAGAEVAGFAVRNAGSKAEAADQLREYAGVSPPGHVGLDAMLAAEPIDALAICTPHETHEPALRAALDRGLHVLCEKPLVWGGAGWAARARAIAGGFAAKQLVLFENCQWPYALPAFGELHPGSLDASPRSFRMMLQPAGAGERMLADSLPHVLSLLQVLLPGDSPRVEQVAFSTTDAQARTVVLRFAYHGAAAHCAVEVDLRRSSGRRREARLAIDGAEARRLVASRDYQLSLHDVGRSVPLPDPLGALVADFVGAVRKGDPDAGMRASRIVERLDLLEQITEAWRLASG